MTGAAPAKGSGPARGRGRLPATVIALGITSLLTDVGSEMIFPLLPIFLTETLGGGPGLLGLIEGAADMVASLLKLVSGYAADRLEQRKPLVALGYGIAGAVRPLVAIATAPWHVLVVRVSDRVGKGLRTSPRDAMIADSVDPSRAGRAFGFHRAMDHAGAVTGPLVASAALAAGVGLRSIFWLAAIPGIAALGVVLSIRERRPGRADEDAGDTATTPVRESRPASPLPRPLSSYLAILLVFSLGNSSDAFLLLRAREMGLSAATIPILWSLFHVSKVLCTLGGGSLADRFPRSRVIVTGWIVYAGVYLGLGLDGGSGAAWAFFMIYGLYHGLTEPAEKALVRDLSTETTRGRAFGYYSFIVGLSALPASLLTGWIWREWGSAPALATGAAFAGAASLALLVWDRARSSEGPRRA